MTVAPAFAWQHKPRHGAPRCSFLFDGGPAVKRVVLFVWMHHWRIVFG